jgi:hypothetical protein
MGILLAFVSVNKVLIAPVVTFASVLGDVSMPLLIALTACIQAFFLFQVFRTGRPHWWALLILFAPIVGCVIYYLIEIFPGSREHRNARLVANHLAQAFMPNSELQRRLMEVERCPSVNNRIAAAEGLMRCGMYHRAVGMYEGALRGIYSCDPQLMLGLARAHVNNHTFYQATQVLERLHRIDPRFRPEDARLLNARALEGLGCHHDALREYEGLMHVFVGLEAKCRYGLLLKRLGFKRQADNVFNDVLVYACRFNIRLGAEQVWIDTAKRSLIEARA